MENNCNGNDGHEFNKINRYQLYESGEYICEYCWNTKFLVDPVLNQEKYISKFIFTPKEENNYYYPLIRCGFDYLQTNPDAHILHIPIKNKGIMSRNNKIILTDGEFINYELQVDENKIVGYLKN